MTYSNSLGCLKVKNFCYSYLSRVNSIECFFFFIFPKTKAQKKEKMKKVVIYCKILTEDHKAESASDGRETVVKVNYGKRRK